MEHINGGVCASLGFKAGSVHCGIRKNTSKKDLSLIVSDKECKASAVYTTNLVKGAPLLVTKENISDGKAKAIICNSGNANTCNDNGIEIAETTCELLADKLSIDKKDVVVASTGVIGEKLSIDPIKDSLDDLISSLSSNGSTDASLGIMTTDTKPKEVAVKFNIGDKKCHIGGIAKGSGMIHPDMATMLVFITSDVNISSEMLNKALKTDIKETFNMLSIDGDTSTNDMVVVLSNGMAENEEITTDDDNFKTFAKALNTVTVELCKMIAADGEGATKMLECIVSGAKDLETAKTVAKSVVCSSLLKAAMFGADANWGRVLCAIGYSKANVDINKIDVSFKSNKGTLDVCKNGADIGFSEEIAKEILLENEIDILVNLNDGEYKSTAWGCDLTYDYVKINGDYRT